MKKLRAFLPLLLWMALIFGMSATPGEISGEQSGLLAKMAITALSLLTGGRVAFDAQMIEFCIRKAAHMTEYAVMWLLACHAFKKTGAKRPAMFALALCAVYAATDEFHQSFTAGRGPSVIDVLIDTSGACLMAVLRRGVYRLLGVDPDNGERLLPNAVVRWTLAVLGTCAAVLAGCAMMVYTLDPFEIYRESDILPLYDQESYNNPGIAKNYDYDAVILGTSMIEMSHPSVIDECFSVRSVKLPMRGSHTAQMGWQLDHVLRSHELKLAILAVDAYSLMGPPDDMEEIYDYLWNDDPLDDVNYLLNRDVLLVKIPRLLNNREKPLDGKRDDMYQWTDVTFSRESVFAATAFMRQREMQDAEYRAERAEENIARHIERYAQAHPETTFKIYMPPYSVAYWYLMTRNGLSEQQYRSRARVCEKLLGYPNVEIYDFSSRVEWITDLDAYFDYSHHNGAVSDAIMRAMAAGENRVQSTGNMEAGSERIRQAVSEFIQTYEPEEYRK